MNGLKADRDGTTLLRFFSRLALLQLKTVFYEDGEFSDVMFQRKRYSIDAPTS
jgi:hypothetical protein